MRCASAAIPPIAPEPVPTFGPAPPGYHMPHPLPISLRCNRQNSCWLLQFQSPSSRRPRLGNIACTSLRAAAATCWCRAAMCCGGVSCRSSPPGPAADGGSSPAAAGPPPLARLACTLPAASSSAPTALRPPLATGTAMPASGESGSPVKLPLQDPSRCTTGQAAAPSPLGCLSSPAVAVAV